MRPFSAGCIDTTGNPRAAYFSARASAGDISFAIAAVTEIRC
jgi:hypothetical protein